MTPEEIRETIKTALHEELGPYRVDKEQHYKDHLFLDGLRKWMGTLKSTFWSSLVKMLVAGLVFLALLGFVVWSK